MIYCFRCPDSDHDALRHGPVDFEKSFSGIPKGIVQQVACACGAIAKRDFSREIPTQNTIGSTPIAVSDSKHSIGGQIKFAFGRFRKNPDGSVDKNHAAFDSTGDLEKFMNGANDLGPPVLDNDGNAIRERIRDKKGNVHEGRVTQRRGAKLIKYGRNDGPPRNKPLRRTNAEKVNWGGNYGQDTSYKGGLSRI